MYDSGLNTGVEILTHEGEGFSQILRSGGWRVAILNHSERYDENSPILMNKHLDGDECFILLQGYAKLLIAESNEIPAKDRKVYEMELNTIYIVLNGFWHHLWLSKDAKILVVENSKISSFSTLKCEVER